MTGRYRWLLAAALALVMSAATGLGVAWAESGDRAAVDPALTDALADAADPVQVVVTFHGEAAPTREDVAVLRDAGITTGLTFQALPVAGVLATADQVDALAADSRVRSLYLNQEMAYDNDGATALTGVDDARTDARYTRRNGGLPLSGKGVGVLVNDSGIDGTHADLAYGPHVVQNVVSSTNLNAIERSLLPVTYVEDVPNTDATGGHGTHVAGIVGGTGAKSGGKYEGVAPGADLIGYGSGATLLLLDVLGGFDYAIANQARYGIRVITNSWGNSSDACTDVNPDHPTTMATKRAYDRNIVVVFSAGNSGPDECTITGNYKKAPWAVAVAAGTKQGELTDFSSRGTPGGGGTFTVDGETWTWEDRPTVTAPGSMIVSTRNASPIGVIGAPDDIETIDPAHLPYYTTLSGTSMAAPHVAGIIALMLEANPRLTPLQVKRILQDTATPMSGNAPFEVGAGYVDAYDAIGKAYKTR